MENYIMNNDNEESYFSDPYENQNSVWIPPVRFFLCILCFLGYCGPNNCITKSIDML